MSYSWKLHLLRTYCHRVPHLPHNKPFFTFFNNNYSLSSSPTFIHLFHHPFFKFLNKLSSLYSVTSLYFSTNLSFLFRKPFFTSLPTLYHRPFFINISFRGSLNFQFTLAASLFIFYRWAFCLSCPPILW